MQCRSSDERGASPSASNLSRMHLGDTPVCPGREEVMGEMSPSDSPHPYPNSISSRAGRGIPVAV